MVAKITTGKSIRGMLHYNENKVLAGEAKLILSSGFAGDIERVNFGQKLQRFQHLTELKPNVKTNAMHISLNFHTSEYLDNGTLQSIAASYMEKIGFGEQPFLVYRHDDAAHQHLHITTTNITAKGERIDVHDIGKKISEPARKALETEYGLIRAEERQQSHEAVIRPAELEKVRYGRLPTKKAIGNVVTAVARDYKFTSLAEYNAVLRCFNVVAFTGAEGTAMFANKGLLYSLLDQKGTQVGVPIKSSAFYSKPTLRSLEKKFESSAEERKTLRAKLKERIGQVLAEAGGSNRSGFTTACKRLGIDVAYRKNAEGQVFGITFVDHRNRVVFNGSDLGKAYSAKAVMGRFAGTAAGKSMQRQVKKLNLVQKGSQKFDLTEATSAKISGHFTLPVYSKPAFEEGIKIPKRRKKKRKKQIINQELNL